MILFLQHTTPHLAQVLPDVPVKIQVKVWKRGFKCIRETSMTWKLTAYMFKRHVRKQKCWKPAPCLQGNSMRQQKPCGRKWDERATESASSDCRQGQCKLEPACTGSGLNHPGRVRLNASLFVCAPAALFQNRCTVAQRLRYLSLESSRSLGPPFFSLSC